MHFSLQKKKKFSTKITTKFGFNFNIKLLKCTNQTPLYSELNTLMRKLYAYDDLKS